MKKRQNQLLGVKPMMSLIATSQREKLYNMITDKKFSIEAIEFLINDEILNYEMCKRVIESYSYRSFFNSFEKFVCSKMARVLYDAGESNKAFGWLDDYSMSSEEIIDIYNRNEEVCGEVIYKNMVYRNRETNLNSSLMDSYGNSLHGIYNIMVNRFAKRANGEITEATLNDALAELYRWAQYITVDFVKKTEGIVGVQETVNMVKARLSHRKVRHNIHSIKELKGLYGYLQSKNEELTSIVEVIDPNTWRLDYENPLVLEQEILIYKDEYQKIYDLFLKDSFENEELVSDNIVVRHDETKATIMMLFSKDEKAITKAFIDACKGNSSIMIEATIMLMKKGRGFFDHFTITKEMSDYTISKSLDIVKVILSEDITTADELIELMYKIKGRFEDKISSFRRCHHICERIKIGEFSDEEFDKIADMIVWEEINNYFSEGRVPFEFLKKHSNRIESLIIGDFLYVEEEYTFAQKIELIELFGNRLITNQFNALVQSLLFVDNEELNEETAFKLINLALDAKKENDYISLQLPSYGKTNINKNVDLQSILTYL